MSQYFHKILFFLLKQEIVGIMIGINKKVSGKELIETPAGKFQCIKIEFFHDINNDGIWDDDIKIIQYLAPEGLIKETVFVELIVTDMVGDTIGKGFWNEVSELTSFTLLK